MEEENCLGFTNDLVADDDGETVESSNVETDLAVIDDPRETRRRAAAIGVDIVNLNLNGRIFLLMRGCEVGYD